MVRLDPYSYISMMHMEASDVQLSFCNHVLITIQHHMMHTNKESKLKHKLIKQMYVFSS